VKNVKISKHGKVYSSSEYTYFPNAMFAVLLNSPPLMLMYY